MGLQQDIRQFLGIELRMNPLSYEVIGLTQFNDFDRQLIEYEGSRNDRITAYLFIPTKEKIRGAVLVHHQHAGERHLGKSEVSGLVGDPYQFFCPALAERGLIAIAPDSICFEDRRSNKKGTAVDEEADFLQHYNEMCYRLLHNEILMKQVVEDSSIAISILSHSFDIDPEKIGILGHSYGGNTVLFHSALDERIKFSCSSGSACSYRTKMKYGIGIEMAEVIPGFVQYFDIDDLLSCICHRKLLIVSGSEDKYAKDAGQLIQGVMPQYINLGRPKNLSFKEFSGGHELTKERFDHIIDWFIRSM